MIDAGELARTVAEFVRTQQAWGAPIVALLAFGESLAVISLVVPATVILLAIGALVGAADVPVVPLVIGATIGAGLGDWVSYWFGARYGWAVRGMWPFASRPGLLDTGERFFQRFGLASVFVGRFSGPARAVVPLIAGIVRMPFWPFQIANWTSAALWAIALLALPSAGVSLFTH